MAYEKTTSLGKTRPRARGEDEDEYNKRQESRNKRWDDNDGVKATTKIHGVETNALGVPQYEYSERSAKSAADDKDGDGYSDFYTENPSSTISPEAYQRRKIAAKAAGMLLSPLVGLGAATVTRMQKAGILPNGFNVGSGGGGGAGNTEFDKRVNDTLSDKSLTLEEKQAKVSEMVNDKMAEAEGKTQAAAATGMMKPMVKATQGNSNVQQVANDPSAFLDNGGLMADQVPTMSANTAGTTLDDIVAPERQVGYEAAQGTTTDVSAVEQQSATGYEAVTSADQVAEDGQMEAALGEVSDEAVLEAEQVDMDGVATGTNADGTTNQLGKALDQAANQNISRVIDTSTTAGKLLAQELGEGNYTDAKSTVQGQMEILSKQFVDSEGNPKIPSWAAGVARSVSKIAAFKGMTGTAATMAMGQAIMEASLPIAQQDAQFFQTVTLKNLDNRQQAVMNKANVLSKMELANLDARMQAAVVNSQNFMQMDMANLANEQQAEVINTQARVQSILEDSKAKNAARMFSAEAENDFTKFYDQLNSQIEMFSAEQKNAMTRFNTGEVNAAERFTSQMDQQREQFYSEMQYNVDLANARWRQTVETTNTQMQFEAAKTDVQNMFNLTSEAINQMWDREDALLDYTWKTAEGAKNREVQRYAADRNYELKKREIDNEEDAAFGQSLYEGGKMILDAGDTFGWW